MWKIISGFSLSSKSLHVQNSFTADGGNIVQGPYGGSNNQKWFVQHLGGGVYSIRNVNSNKGMDVSGVSTADGVCYLFFL